MTRGVFKLGWSQSGIIGLGLLLFLGCQSQGESHEVESSMSAYRDRMLVQHQDDTTERGSTTAKPVAWQSDLSEKAALMTQPPATTQPSPQEVLDEIPDPAMAPEVFHQRLAELEETQADDVRIIKKYEEVVGLALDYLREVERPKKVRLSLSECVQRALEHNYTIRIESYNPAISQAQLVEAEAAFDAEFFLDSSWSKQDQATVSAFMAGSSDTRAISGGFRQLLPTGMQVSTALSQQRQKTNFPQEYQSINPVYSTSFIVEFRQPLLRGFGLEYNRAQINIRRAERDIAYESFIQQVRDTLMEVERSYWTLVQARRQASILAMTVAQNKVTYNGIYERLGHDATKVELANAESRWHQREVDYLEALRNIRDVEDQLKNLLSDPDLKLSGEIEIIPTEIPFAAGLSLDQLAVTRTALDNRSEIRQSRRAIDQARLSTMAAKNQTLPQLDLSFQYEVQGIGPSGDSSFDNLTTNRFISYTVSAQFSVPIGNRQPRAVHRQARLRESQAIVALHQWTDEIVRQVNGAVRALHVRHAQIDPQLKAVRAATRNLRALQARTQRIDPLYLDNELNTVENLARARTTLLQVITDYNVALIALEQAKGTLLEYNNVVITDQPPER